MNAVEKTITNWLNSFVGVVIFTVSMIAFYLPYEVEIIPEVVKALVPVRYVCGGLLIVCFFVLYCSRKRVFRDNWYLWAACIFMGMLVFTTYMNGADMSSVLGKKGVTGIFAILNMAVFLKVNPKKYLLIAFFWYLLINIANTFCLFYFWGVGLWEEWGTVRSELISLVGNYNGGVEFVLPMAVCGSAWAHRYGKWLEYINYAAMVMSVIMALKCDSLTQVAVFCAMIFFMILGDIAMIAKGAARVIRWIFNPVFLTVINLIAYVGIIWMGNSGWLSRFGIDPDFHGRRHIWDMAINLIQQKPIWGHGLESVDVIANKIYGYAHAHSFFLQTQYMTGIVGTAVLAAALVIVIVAWFRVKNDRLAYVMSFTMCCLCLTDLFEMYTVPFFIYTLGIIYYIGKTNVDEAPKARKKRGRIRETLG